MRYIIDQRRYTLYQRYKTVLLNVCCWLITWLVKRKKYIKGGSGYASTLSLSKLNTMEPQLSPVVNSFPKVFLDAANEKSFLNDKSLVKKRIVFYTDSIMIRLIPFYDYLVQKYGQDLIERALLRIVEYTVALVDGHRYSIRCKEHLVRSICNITIKDFDALKDDVLRLIDYRIYMDGFDYECEEGELRLWHSL